MNRLVLGVLIALATRGAAASPRPWTFHHERFDLTLPQGWKPAAFVPHGGERRFEPLADPGAAEHRLEIHFAGPRGDYFSVYVWPETEFEMDALWDIRAGKDGSSLDVVREGARCERPQMSGYEGPCSTGNGSLEIVTSGVELQGSFFVFVFGNVGREEGIDLAPFREILHGFRAHRAAPPDEKGSRDPAAPVREAYRIERIQLANQGPARPDRPVPPWFEPHRSRLFSKRFAALWDADDRCFRETGAICNMDLDPFIWGQDFTDPKLPDLVLDVVRRAGDRAEVRARFTSFQPKQVSFDVIREHGRWVIDDIRGPDGSVAASLGR